MKRATSHQTLRARLWLESRTQEQRAETVSRQTWVWLAMRLRRWMLASDILSRSSATGLPGTLPCTPH